MDDDPAMVGLVSAVLTAAGFAAPTTTTTGAGGLALAADIDLVLLDLQLPDMSGLEVLAALRRRPAPPPIIVVTAHGSESAAVQALRLGADDYLLKDAALGELLPQVVERHRRITALRQALAAAERDLLQAERRTAVGELTVSLHHAINNPLMAATMETELLLRDPALNPAQREGMAAVHDALIRIRDVVHRATELRDAPTVDYLEGGIRMVDLYAEAGGGAVHQGAALVVATDPRLARVLGHLLRHAGFATQECAVEELARWIRDQRPAFRAVVVQAEAVTAAALPPDGAARPFLVAVGGATALAPVADRVDLAIPTPFDPGTFVGDLLARLDQRGE
ncbi:MAG: response regulator [Gemmatimonadales bacterium]